MEREQEKKEAKALLTDIRVTNVDLVDRAANLERFLIMKKQEVDEMDRDKEKREEELAGELVAKDESGESTGSNKEAATNSGQNEKVEKDEKHQESGESEKKVEKNQDAKAGEQNKEEIAKGEENSDPVANAMAEFEEGIAKLTEQFTTLLEKQGGGLIGAIKDKLNKLAAVKDLPEEAKAILKEIMSLADQLRGYGRAPRGYGYGYPKPGYYPAPRVQKDEQGEGEEIAKAGAVLSRTNKKKVKAALDALQALLAAAEKEDRESVKKSEREVELEAKVQELEAKIEKMEGQLKVSKSLGDDGNETKDKDKKVSWANILP